MKTTVLYSLLGVVVAYVVISILGVLKIYEVQEKIVTSMIGALPALIGLLVKLVKKEPQDTAFVDLVPIVERYEAIKDKFAERERYAADVSGTKVFCKGSVFYVVTSLGAVNASIRYAVNGHIDHARAIVAGKYKNVALSFRPEDPVLVRGTLKLLATGDPFIENASIETFIG